MTRDETINVIHKTIYQFFDGGDGEPMSDKDKLLLEVNKAICNNIKALEQEPKTGRWIMSDDGLYRPICNNCGAHPWKGYIPTVEEATKVFKYCPKCGARMESEEQDDDR